MSNRVSSAGFHDVAIAEILARQAALAKTQTQVASGKRFQSPAEDPIAATQVVDLESSRAQLEQFARNAVTLNNRLQINEQALTDVGDVLQRVRVLTVQANSAALDSSARGAIATEIRARVKELQDIGNRRDAGGEFLFAGYSNQTQPFSRGAAGVTYAGDQGIRTLQISPDQRVADGFSGADVFMNVPEDNGVFATAEGVHTGAGSIDNGHVVNQSLWVQGNFTVRFPATDTWEVVDSTNAVVATGAYTAGSAISFNGGQVIVSGAPAAGDTFLIRPAGRESLFDTLDQLATTLTSTSDDPSGRATLNTGINAALAQIDQGLTRVINQRADVGARLATVDSAELSRGVLSDDLNAALSQLRDLDYASAIGKMNQQLTGLQAAQAAYTRISQLSLFNFL